MSDRGQNGIKGAKDVTEILKLEMKKLYTFPREKMRIKIK